MFERQHSTYKRLSAQFGGSRQHQRSEKHRHYSQAEATVAKPALSTRDFVDWVQIGHGGFGKVFRAMRRHGDECVAVKVVDKRALKNSAAELRLATEVAIHESLSHVGVVPLYDSFEDDRSVYLVMEHCAGGDLWRYLKKRGSGGLLAALAESEARHIMRQITAAVAYLHLHDVLHRDLKLANILLTQSMDIRIADFGLATWVGHVEPTTMCGTPSYISPEIIACQPYGLEADVWALGCLLVTLLTGSQPFKENKGEITEGLVDAIRLPRSVSREARSLVRGLLRVDPAARIRSDRILDHPFFALPAARLPTIAQVEEEEKRREAAAARRYILPPKPHPSVEYEHKPHGGTAAILGRLNEQRSANEPYNRRSAEIVSYTAPLKEEPPRHRYHAPAATNNTAQDDNSASDLENFTTARLQPMKRAMKNGKVYLRADHLLVLDLASNTTLVALNEHTREIYEFKRPLLQLDALTPHAALRIHAWSTQSLPATVAKAVRVAIRCVSYLLAQKARINISTAQGMGWLFEDGGNDARAKATFKFAFHNGVKIEISRIHGEAIVEIPSAIKDLPNEILKIPLAKEDEEYDDGEDADYRRRYPRGQGVSDDSRVPGKIRGVLAHAKDALRRVVQFDSILREFEDHGSMADRYEGQIKYPVELSWEWDVTAATDYVPPGLRKRSHLSRNNPTTSALAIPMSVSNTAGSTTVVANNIGHRARRPAEPKPVYEREEGPPGVHRKNIERARKPQQQEQQWDTRFLDRRTVDDTPTRRLNLGPLTRLVQEFNHPASAHPTPAKQHAQYNILRTPRSPLILRTPANPATNKLSIHDIAQQTFQNACYIPDVGWCMAAAEDEADPDDCLITMLFCDGCRVLVNAKDHMASYKDAAYEHKDLPFDHNMPIRVKERLSWLPQFLSIMGLGA
ncbi:hypothetical protein GGI20_002067 [Coemansia sp. BCRC 34301]|nr:hypothetical protein GGI20_002067 [Coemansia sp. BCRC 34301]